jgi:hypothetical protein
MLGFERGSTSSHCLEYSIWKMLWACRKTDCKMMVNLRAQGADRQPILKIFSKEVESKQK